MQPTGIPTFVRDLVPPSECGLLEWLRSRVSRLMLEEIAENDYGRDHAKHLAAIEAQLGDQPQLGFLPWHPWKCCHCERLAQL